MRDEYIDAACMFCGKKQAKRLEMWSEIEFALHNRAAGTTYKPDVEWFFCTEHGMKIQEGLGSFFTALMAKNDDDEEGENEK